MLQDDRDSLADLTLGGAYVGLGDDDATRSETAISPGLVGQERSHDPGDGEQLFGGGADRDDGVVLGDPLQEVAKGADDP